MYQIIEANFYKIKIKDILTGDVETWDLGYQPEHTSDPDEREFSEREKPFIKDFELIEEIFNEKGIIKLSIKKYKSFVKKYGKADSIEVKDRPKFFYDSSDIENVDMNELREFLYSQEV